MKANLRNFFFILFLFLSILLLFFYKKENKKEINYPYAVVKKGKVESHVYSTGRIDAIERVSVGAQVTGQVKSMKVKLGQLITKGQLIAVIDDTPQLNDLRNAEAAMNVVQSDLQAQNALLHQVELHYRRLVYLLKMNLISRDDFESTEAKLNSGRAEITSLRAKLVQAEIEVERKKIELGYTQVIAPMNGVVIAILTNQGQTVNSSQTSPTIIQLARLDIMTIKAQISEADIPLIHIGQEAYFTIFSEPNKRYKATLRTIELAPESIIKGENSSNTQPSNSSFSGTPVYYNALLDIPNQDNKFLIGMTAEVSLLVKKDLNALLIPIDALKNLEGNEGLVQTFNKNGNSEKRKIRTGIKGDTEIQVVEGLHEGDRVLLPSLPLQP
ncbi:MAG: efflux RND transporter periplasmic adaptor subunit [Pantoea agglomerans]